MILLLEPPPQYDHPFAGHVIEQRLSYPEIVKACGGLTTGCSFVRDGVCHIALPHGEQDGRLLALMRRHEIGHCNGWPSSHSNGRRVEYDDEKKTIANKPRKPGVLNFSFD